MTLRTDARVLASQIVDDKMLTKYSLLETIARS